MLHTTPAEKLNAEARTPAMTEADRQIAFYKSLRRTRRVEETLADEYRTGIMRTPTHFGIGQEAVAVGACAALRPTDFAFSHHRCHTHYLAKGGSLLGLVAELLGRETGCSRGRGGSVHLTDQSAGFLASSPILGEGIALAVGTALADKMDNRPRVSATFFGDGACDEGAVWESFNFATIHRLPVVFFCENNLYATESPLSVRQASGTEICERARAFKLEAVQVDGNDVNAVYQAAVRFVERARAGEGPSFLECMTYRWREHVGPLWDYEAKRTYRTKAELEDWMTRCPVQRSAAGLIERGLATRAEVDAWDAEIEAEIRAVLTEAKAAPWPDPSSLFDNVY